MNGTKPEISLKNVKYCEAMSEDTNAYAATIYVDGKRWANVRNSGQGGHDDVDPISGGWKAVRDLNDRIKATFPRVEHKLFPEGFEPSLETVCGALLDAFLFQKHWTRILRQQVCAIQGGEIYTWPLKHKPTPIVLERFRAKFPDYTVLNDMPRAEAFKLLKEAETD